MSRIVGALVLTIDDQVLVHHGFNRELSEAPPVAGP